ncbi:MAG: hypothetical protein KDA90_13635 [Planctomycetaceae bacterium]|nr:hypothetical protein [Planctomycetaceae bacterium]
MLMLVRVLATCSAFALFASQANAQELAPSSEFFPTAIGTQWVFSAGGVEILERVVAHERIGNDVCARVETVFNGEPVSDEHIAVRPDGIYRVAVAGQPVTPAFRLAKFPPRLNDTWTINSMLADQPIAGSFQTGQDKVTVPAGEYATLTSTGSGFQIGQAKLSFVYHFARGVGKVMQVTKIDGQPDVVLQLKSFTPAKTAATASAIPR